MVKDSEKGPELPPAQGDPFQPQEGAIQTEDDIDWGLRAVVRRIAKQSKSGATCYFFREIICIYPDEIKKYSLNISSTIPFEFERTYLDHLTDTVFVILATKPDSEKETHRQDRNREYTDGADNMRTKAALTILASTPPKLRKTIIEKEKREDRTEQRNKAQEAKELGTSKSK